MTRLPVVVASALLAGVAPSGCGKAVAPASRRVIERTGGALHDVSPSGRLRYWAPTRHPGRAG